MKKIMVILMAMMLLLTSCGMFAKPIPATESVSKEITDAVDETVNVAESFIETTIAEIVSETTITEESVKETNDQENNDFYAVLDALKNVHPGTAGASLEVVYESYNLLNSLKAKLPFDKIVVDWLEKQNKDDYSNINESFNFIYESIDSFKGDQIKDLLSDVGIEVADDASLKNIVDEAKKILNIVIEKTKQ